MDIFEARQLFADCGDEVNIYRAHYKNAYGTDTSLTDDQIIHMVCTSDDDMDPEGWAVVMKNIEQAPVSV